MLGISDTFVVEFVHDERQIHPTHASMIAPGLAKTVGAKVAGKSCFTADRRNEFPGLAALDGERVIVCG